MSQLVCVGQIVNVHGVKGMVKIRPYLKDPMGIGALGPLSDKSGKYVFDVKAAHLKNGFIVARIKGIEDRTAAERLKGVELYVAQSSLPKAQTNEFYYSDLIGLRVLENNQEVGQVVSVQNYGAGDILEIKTKAGKIIPLPFSKQTFPLVDIEKRMIILNTPIGMEKVVYEG